jgi:hypothetical protein
MKVFHSDITFNYPWEEVSTANWRKYCPWNDKSTHVIAVDTLSRSVDPETGIVRYPPLPNALPPARFFLLLFVLKTAFLSIIIPHNFSKS